MVHTTNQCQLSSLLNEIGALTSDLAVPGSSTSAMRT
jgi:hypothetical protein